MNIQCIAEEEKKTKGTKATINSNTSVSCLSVFIVNNNLLYIWMYYYSLVKDMEKVCRIGKKREEIYTNFYVFFFICNFFLAYFIKLEKNIIFSNEVNKHKNHHHRSLFFNVPLSLAWFSHILDMIFFLISLAI